MSLAKDKNMKKKYTIISLLVLGLALMSTAIYQNQKTGEVSSALITIGIFCFVGAGHYLKGKKK